MLYVVGFVNVYKKLPRVVNSGHQLVDLDD